MSVHEPATRLPDELDSPRAKLVYMYLDSRDLASVSDIEEAVGMKRITLYSILKTLRKRGLVKQDGDRYSVP